MESTDSNARWQEIAALRDELDRPAVVVPICVSRLDGRRHELSPKARSFAEALSFSESWTRISEARNRGLAA
jgi:hypothetical protein